MIRRDAALCNLLMGEAIARREWGWKFA